MPFDITDFLHTLFWFLVLVLNGMVFLRFFRSRFGKTKTVKAQVVDKQTVEQFAKYVASGRRTRYAVTFLVEGRKKSFYVSELSYSGYHKGEQGTLTYKGDRIIDFR